MYNPRKFFLSVAVVLVTACGGPKHEGALQDSNQEKLSALSFENIKSRILVPACVQCHNHYNNYEDVVRVMEQINESVQTGRMPKAGVVSASSKKLLADWVAAGGPEKSGGKPIGGSLPSEVFPTWKSLQAQLFRPHCVVCHSPSGEVPWVDFTSFESIMAEKDELFDLDDAQNSYIVEVILDPEEPMPPKESKVHPVNQRQIGALILWIKAGLPLD